jgi:enoyl-CoA hydratase/carnithine racemase
MSTLTSLTYKTAGRIARMTLDRPERGNAITLEMPGEAGFKQAVRERDEPFGDAGRSTFKGWPRL